jgi:hypothetical protein
VDAVNAAIHAITAAAHNHVQAIHAHVLVQHLAVLAATHAHNLAIHAILAADSCEQKLKLQPTCLVKGMLVHQGKKVISYLGGNFEGGGRESNHFKFRTLMPKFSPSFAGNNYLPS